MARHRRRRSFRGITTIPGLGGFEVLKKDVEAMDVLVGAAVGFVGSALVKGAAKKFLASSYPQIAQTVGKFMPAATGLAVGAIAYYAQKKSKSGLGHAIGAVSAGVGMTVRDFAADALGSSDLFDFSEVTQVNLGRYGGLLVNDATNGYAGLLVNDATNGYGGLLVSDATDNKGLNDLARVSMGDDSDGLHELARM